MRPCRNQALRVPRSWLAGLFSPTSLCIAACAILPAASFTPIAVQAFERDLPAAPRPALTEAPPAEIVIPGFDLEEALKDADSNDAAVKLRRLKPLGRFELLPNWEAGRNACTLLPNYVPGSVEFLLLAQPTYRTNAHRYTISLTPDPTAPVSSPTVKTTSEPAALYSLPSGSSVAK
ncbi:MAG: hypothetical protein HY288_12630 [Planctomycetia bacterium]|nr:hypothetical protein [Planctomycetia bacterium]